MRRRAALAPGVLADRVFVVELEPALLDLVEDEFDRHQLGEARRENELVGVALEQHVAVFGVDQDGMRRADADFVLLDRGAAAFFAAGGAASLAAMAGPAASAAASKAGKILRQMLIEIRPDARE